MQFPFDVLIAQLTALFVPGSVFFFIQKCKVFHARYRLGVLFILGIAVGLELAFLPGVFWYAEDAVRWQLRQEGTKATARIVSSYEGGTYSRRFGRVHRNWSRYYEATCEYTDASGVRLQGSIEISPEMPHLPGDKAPVRYLPSDSSVMREDYDLAAARDPEKWPYVWLPWIANIVLFFVVYSDARARKRRAMMAGILDFPY